MWNVTPVHTVHFDWVVTVHNHYLLLIFLMYINWNLTFIWLLWRWSFLDNLWCLIHGLYLSKVLTNNSIFNYFGALFSIRLGPLQFKIISSLYLLYAISKINWSNTLIFLFFTFAFFGIYFINVLMCFMLIVFGVIKARCEMGFEIEGWASNWFCRCFGNLVAVRELVHRGLEFEDVILRAALLVGWWQSERGHLIKQDLVLVLLFINVN